MPKHTFASISFGETLVDFAKDLGGALLKGFGFIIGIGVAAGVLGGIGGGIVAAVYGFPIVGFAIGGAVIAAIAVYAIWLLAHANL